MTFMKEKKTKYDCSLNERKNEEGKNLGDDKGFQGCGQLCHSLVCLSIVNSKAAGIHLLVESDHVMTVFLVASAST
jgi:hypothetical protein